MKKKPAAPHTGIKRPPLRTLPPVTIPKPKPIDRPAIIDEFGQITARLAESRVFEQRYEQLRKQIVGWYEASDPDEAYSEEGNQYSVVIGPCVV